MTGTVECWASSTMSLWGPTLATMPATMLDITLLVSWRDSFTPSWMSSFPRNIVCPPIVVMADSVETRVRVLRLLKSSAMVLCASTLVRLFGMLPNFRADLWEEAFRIRFENSSTSRSAMERRCRGAGGDMVVDRHRFGWRELIRKLLLEKARVLRILIELLNKLLTCRRFNSTVLKLRPGFVAEWLVLNWMLIFALNYPFLTLKPISLDRHYPLADKAVPVCVCTVCAQIHPSSTR